MYSIPDFIVLAFSSPVSTYEAKMLPIVESSQPGTTIGMFFSAAAIIHEFFGIDLIILFQVAAVEHAEHELVREQTFAIVFSIFPHLEQVLSANGGMLPLPEYRYPSRGSGGSPANPTPVRA